MLQKLNERLRGVVAWLVVILIAITFTLFGVDYYLQSRYTTDAKVTVNDHPITAQAFEVSYRRARAQQDLASMTTTDEKNLQNQVLNQLITNEVTVQAARKYGFEVSPDQANTAIVNIPQFQEDGHFSAERYQHALNGALFTPETFQNEVRQGMLLNQQRFAFIGTSFALQSEIDRFVTLYMQTRDYEYLRFAPSLFINQVKISDEDISKYYNDHKKEFMEPEKVSVDYVLLSSQDIKSQVKVSDEEIKRYYEENVSNYMTPAQWQVAHILFAIPENASKEEVDQIEKKAQETYAQLQKDPKHFNELVSSLSDDKLSVADKGVLPWITAGQNEYDKILAQLTTPGQISQPEKTKHGFELFKLIAYRPVTTKSLSQVQSMIKDQLTADLVQTQFNQALEQLSDLSYQTPDTLSPVADALKLQVKQSQIFSRSGGVDPISKNKLVVNAAFSHDVLKLGNNSEPIQLDNNSVIVLRINQHIPAKEQSLTQAHDLIKAALAKNLAQRKAQELGANFINPVDDVKQQQLLTENHINWQSVINAPRDYDHIDSQINDLAFNLLRPLSRNAVSLPNGDYVVVRLRHINDGKLSNLDKEQRDSLIQQIESSYGMMDYDLYVNNLINQAKIERH